MATLQPIGGFRLTHSTVVITDPLYDEESARISGLGCLISNCRTGDWRVELLTDRTTEPWGEMPRIVTAIYAGFPTPPDQSDWLRVGDEIGGDTAQLGIYDLAHFHDDSLVPDNQQWTFDGGPAIPDDLWYSMNCEAVQKQLAATIPHGVVVSWDGGMDVDIFVSDHEVVAIRLSISGWPNNI
jgi:hypothetical protein